jgi:hypothetical protein
LYAPDVERELSAGLCLDQESNAYLFSRAVGVITDALLQQAEAKASDHPEWELITNYRMREQPALASKTRETIDADFTGMFDPLTRGKIGELFGTIYQLDARCLLPVPRTTVDRHVGMVKSWTIWTVYS